LVLLLLLLEGMSQVPEGLALCAHPQPKSGHSVATIITLVAVYGDAAVAVPLTVGDELPEPLVPSPIVCRPVPPVVP
jgi:hypothetical protein